MSDFFPEPRSVVAGGTAGQVEGVLKSGANGGRPRLNLNQNDVDKGLARLVLTLVELLRRLLEEQACRRIEAGTLTDEQIERMGSTFMKLDQKMDELLEYFGLEREDLNLDLGPLGNLM